MTDLVLELRPERWKIFEVLPVEGQNDGDVDDLLLVKENSIDGLSARGSLTKAFSSSLSVMN